MCSTWNTLLLLRNAVPLKSHRRSFQPEHLGFKLHAWDKRSARYVLQLLEACPRKTERSMWNMSGHSRRIHGHQVFHVEHKTHFAQKSEPLT